MSSSLRYGRSDRSAPALERPRRGLLADHRPRRLGAALRAAAAALAVHVVVEGEVHLWTTRPEQAVRLLPGDVALVREPAAQHLAHAPGARVPPGGRGDGAGRRRLEPDEPRATPADGPRTTFFCGAYRFEGDLCQSLLAALPDAAADAPGGRAARCARRWTCSPREMLRDEPGQQTLLDRLLDVALVQILREHFTSRDAAAPGWFRASADARIGAALRALHADPGAHVDGRRARRATPRCRARRSRASSPSSSGLAPLAYLNDWRMALARERLRDDRRPPGRDRGVAGLRLGVLVRRGVQAPPRRRARTVARRRPEPTDRLTLPDKVAGPRISQLMGRIRSRGRFSDDQLPP